MALVIAAASCGGAARAPGSGSDGAISGGGTPGGGTSGGGTPGGGTSGGGTSDGGTFGSGGSGNVGGTGGGAGYPDGGAGFVPPTCAAAPRPAGAPVLQKGVWKNISPPQTNFGGDPGAGDDFTQGVTLDPCNPATLYLCVVNNTPGPGKAGLFRTTDAGTTWTRLGELQEPINVVIDPKDPLHLYVSDGVRGATNGFWVSKDGGKTFTLPDSFTKLADTQLIRDVYHVDADPTDFNHVLVSFHNAWKSGNQDAGVIESLDGGDSWIVHPPVSGWGYGHDVLFLYNPALGIGDSKTWLLGTQGNGYWRTTNAGAAWTKVTSSNMEHGGTTLYYTRQGVLYAAANQRLIKSADNGATWSPLGPNGGYLSVIGDGTHLYTGTHFDAHYITALESADQTWTNYDDTRFGEGPFQMAFDAANGILYGANVRAGLWALKVR